MCKQTVKEVVKEMCKAMPGGRSAMAGALGISEASFNNKLYEKNGCRFFEHDDLEAMEELSGTKLLVEYHMDRHDMVPAAKFDPAKLDAVELHDMRTELSALYAKLALLTHESLSDGRLTKRERKELAKKRAILFAGVEGYYEALGALYGDDHDE
ncbi:hypothetical protein MNY66_05920 [Moellerella wisconsensis]|uniref:YmfL family putative regulatory protein n=1 Tax=Moellerella wisconsensis TaxID=158849 RepID=UPI001F4E08BB|nr:YmfL family putative regulatory protein [Moellerella wisconsensis]UNH43510.1 hypothetical protein MNY66_05920 [Moellerella wisconsensis]